MSVNVQAPGGPLDATLRDFVAGQKLFKRYTLKQILGRGGMGVVWLARDDVLERDVALKFLPELVIFDRAMLSDLKRETNRSLELTHKNIVRINDFVHDEKSACISMEYIDGDTLSNIRVDRPSKVFECSELGNWTKQLCEALDYAHNYARVGHRDLKPSNLMVNRQGDLKVADFGIARSLSESVSMLTMGRHTSGTLVYMSPQQLDGGRGTPLDDIYSLGATFYELLTSKPPFYSGNIDRQIHERIPPPMNQRREELDIVDGEPIDPLWEQIVAACLQKDPALRPQSALEIVGFLTAPVPKTSRRMAGWLTFPSRKADQKTAQWPTPTRPAPTPTKTRPKTEIHPKPVREKKFRLAVARTIVAVEEKLRGVAHGAVSAIKSTIRGTGRALVATATGTFRAAAAVATASGNIVLGAGHAFFIVTKETVRGAALVVIPAAAAAGCIWYFAIRPPPPKPQVAQPSVTMQPSQPPKLQPSVTPAESNVAAIAPVPQPPTPPAEGGLWVDTTPAGAKVIVDGGSIVRRSPATFSNLAAGKHHLQIVLPDYMTEEREVEVKGGEIASQGMIVLRARTEPRPAPTPNVVQESPSTPAQKENEQVAAVNKPAQKESEQKVATAKKPARSKQSAPATPTEKPLTPVARQAAARTPPPKIVPKPAATPQQKPQRAFEGGVPGD
jgi:serine/threonine protein kinase